MKSLLETGPISDFLSDCSGKQTYNYLVRKRTLNHLAKLGLIPIVSCLITLTRNIARTLDMLGC